MVSVLLCCTRGADGARSRLRRATGRTVAGAKRAACRCRHRPDPRPADGKRPLLSRHARDLRAPSRAQSVAVDVPEKSRFELRLGGHLIGLAAYRRRKGRIAFTHTEVDESCEGAGSAACLPRPPSRTLSGKGSRSRRSAPSWRTTSSATPSTNRFWPPATPTAEPRPPFV